MPCPGTQPHGIDSQITQRRNIEYNLITHNYHITEHTIPISR